MRASEFCQSRGDNAVLNTVSEAGTMDKDREHLHPLVQTGYVLGACLSIIHLVVQLSTHAQCLQKRRGRDPPAIV